MSIANRNIIGGGSANLKYKPHIYLSQTVNKTAGTGSAQTVNVTFDLPRTIDLNKAIIIVNNQSAGVDPPHEYKCSNDFTLIGTKITVPWYFIAYDSVTGSPSVRIIEFDCDVRIQSGTTTNLTINAPVLDKRSPSDIRFAYHMYKATGNVVPILQTADIIDSYKTTVWFGALTSGGAGVSKMYWWVIDIGGG